MLHWGLCRQAVEVGWVDMVRATSSHRRVGRGFTLIELIVVISIMLLLLASLIGGYSTMQKAQRLRNSTEKVLSTLHLARSLAIANNAIYHVRVENYHEPIAESPDPFSDQCISVYCYTKASDAIAVSDDTSNDQKARDVAAKYQTAWAAYPGATGDAPVWNTSARNIGSKVAAPAPPEMVQYCANYCVSRVSMDPATYLGVQGPDESAPATPAPKIVQFFPDGTIQFPSCGANWGMYVLFVTDHAVLPGATRTAQNDFRETKDATVEANLERRIGHEGKGGSVHIRMIRLLKGGSIKLLDPKVQVEHLKL